MAAFLLPSRRILQSNARSGKGTKKLRVRPQRATPSHSQCALRNLSVSRPVGLRKSV